MRVYIGLRRNQDGVMPGVDEWGDVMNLDYDAETNSVTVRHSDGSGIRRKTYGSGQYTSVSMIEGGGTNSTQYPADAEREHS